MRRSRAATFRAILLPALLAMAAWPPLALGQEENPGPASVSAEVDRTEITIGDRIHYRLTIEYDNGVEIQKPGWGEGLEGFQILDFDQGERQKIGDRWKIEDTYILSTFTPEDYVIPPLAVPVVLPSGATQVLETQPISVSVASVLPEDEETLQLKDLKGPVAVPSGILTERVVIAALAALGILLLLYLVWRYKHREIPLESKAPPLPEHEQAFSRLEALRNRLIGWEEFPSQEDCKWFGFELSETVREYLERRYGFIALEMTTYEIRSYLAARDLETAEGSSRSVKDSILRLLEETDLLKFAKMTRPKGTLSDLLGEAQEVVRTTYRRIGEESGRGRSSERTGREEAA
jgi:hypothetical protein